jgi:hypothetical protein
VPVLKDLGVSCIVRFNSKCYDRAVFTMGGIRHVDLYYEDGANPTDAILQAFLQLCEHEKGAIAVHCKAGLGRTGTNIAAYMMKHYGYSAREATAWHRICRWSHCCANLSSLFHCLCANCRPGSIVGPQQHYLCSKEESLRKEGVTYRLRNNIRDPPEILSVQQQQQQFQQAVANNSNNLAASSTRGTGALTPPLFANNSRNNSQSADTSVVNGQSNLFKPLFKRDGSNGNLVSNVSSQTGNAPTSSSSSSGRGNSLVRVDSSSRLLGNAPSGASTNPSAARDSGLPPHSHSSSGGSTNNNSAASYLDANRRPSTSGGVAEPSASERRLILQQSQQQVTSGPNNLRQSQNNALVLNTSSISRPQSGTKASQRSQISPLPSEEKKNSSRKFAFSDAVNGGTTTSGGSTSLPLKSSARGKDKEKDKEQAIKDLTGSDNFDGVRASYDGAVRNGMHR